MTSVTPEYNPDYLMVTLDHYTNAGNSLRISMELSAILVFFSNNAVRAYADWILQTGLRCAFFVRLARAIALNLRQITPAGIVRHSQGETLFAYIL